jgi:hypothetical protein
MLSVVNRPGARHLVPLSVERRMTAPGRLTLSVTTAARPALVSGDFSASLVTTDAFRLTLDGRVVATWKLSMRRSWVRMKIPIGGFGAIRLRSREDAVSVAAVAGSGPLLMPVRVVR